MSKVQHIATDEKFIDMAYAQFERAIPGGNSWCIVSKDNVLKYVSSPVDVCVQNNIAERVKHFGCNAVVFHSLTDSFLTILDNIPANMKVAWIGWGYDYYTRMLMQAFPQGLLLSHTQNLKQDELKSVFLKRMFGFGKRAVSRLLGYSTKFDAKCLDKIDYFLPVIDEEYELARSLNNGFKPKYLPWNYGTVEDDLGGITAFEEMGDDLLVGNSASYENNHIDLFEYIAERYDLGKRKAVVPLSYGSDVYRAKVLDAGKYYLGDNFMPLLEFMNKESYTRLLGRCGYVFMGHLRQQALGNICIMMLKGARIHLHSQNPLYKWFSKRGAVVDVWNVQNGSVIDLKPLTAEQKSLNQSVIMSNWGRDVQDQKTKVLVEALIGP
ncbi:TDP-N-acetylfucosamine:lipid II N-acetylfucosaminyltransferase [Prosthecochloris sp. HL-130-GSB]|uniref:TDP-N-acetylfucosamine:lipid II N-acetylfucosaminyltransferase n=1 Tax=Prosthecochloris sp. HL-130-GSB TaxID=1974213 RepID=UPI0018DC70EC|nr:TDP-N-acetylfucosamine:lipid II N-acetylfucosaminyltransferase [Prosthecochloris sp. HL-130-GSB]